MDKDKKESNEIEQNEDTTQYGEFISSYFAWLPPEKQKKRAKEINPEVLVVSEMWDFALKKSNPQIYDGEEASVMN